MPHFLSDMAEYHRENIKMSTKSRKGLKKGSPRQLRGTSQCVSPPCSRSPPGRVFYRQGLQTQSFGAHAGLLENLRDVGAHRLQSVELQDGCSGQSPPQVGLMGSAVGSLLAPAPAALPKPPSSWMAADLDEETVIGLSDVISRTDIGSVSNQLKLLLKVQGWIVSVLCV